MKIERTLIPLYFAKLELYIMLTFMSYCSCNLFVPFARHVFVPLARRECAMGLTTQI